jgi:hypothetical protein
MYIIDSPRTLSRILVCGCGAELSLNQNDLFAIIDHNLLGITCNKCNTVYLENGKEVYQRQGKKTMETHELKTDPYVFWAIWNGQKNYELRYSDRDFRVDDDLLLKETRYTGAEMRAGAPLIYTGRTIQTKIRHILKGPTYGLLDGWCILALSPVMQKTDEYNNTY